MVRACVRLPAWCCLRSRGLRAFDRGLGCIVVIRCSGIVRGYVMEFVRGGFFGLLLGSLGVLVLAFVVALPTMFLFGGGWDWGAFLIGMVFLTLGLGFFTISFGVAIGLVYAVVTRAFRVSRGHGRVRPVNGCFRVSSWWVRCIPARAPPVGQAAARWQVSLGVRIATISLPRGVGRVRTWLGFPVGVFLTGRRPFHWRCLRIGASETRLTPCLVLGVRRASGSV